MLPVFYKIILEWNHNAKPWYGIADFDIAKTISMEAVLPEIHIFVRFWHGALMKQVNKVNSFTINQVKWMFLYANVSILIKKNLQACNFIVKMTLVQVFCYEFCQIFENTYFTEKWLVPVFMLKQCVCSFPIYVTVTPMDKTKNNIL